MVYSLIEKILIYMRLPTYMILYFVIKKINSWIIKISMWDFFKVQNITYTENLIFYYMVNVIV